MPWWSCCMSVGTKQVQRNWDAHLTISSTFRRPVANSSAVALSSDACVLCAAQQRLRLRCRLAADCCCTTEERDCRAEDPFRQAAAATTGGKLAAAPLQRRQWAGRSPQLAHIAIGGANVLCTAPYLLTRAAAPALQPASESWRAIFRWRPAVQVEPAKFCCQD